MVLIIKISCSSGNVVNVKVFWEIKANTNEEENGTTRYVVFIVMYIRVTLFSDTK